VVVIATFWRFCVPRLGMSCCQLAGTTSRHTGGRVALVLLATALHLVPQAGGASSETMEPGLVVEHEHYGYPNSSVVIAIDKKVDFWNKPRVRMMMRWRGYIKIQEAGNYTFEAEALGGTKLFIDKKPVISWGANRTLGTQDIRSSCSLTADYHRFWLEYEEEVGEMGVVLKYMGPDTGHALKVVPASAFTHRRGPCDLTKVLHIGAPPCVSAGEVRWALNDGERCEVAACAAGYYPAQGLATGVTPVAPPLAVAAGAATVGRSGVFVGCRAGQYFPAAVCAGLSCTAPVVPNVTSATCQAGEVVADGAECVPKCPNGFIPGAEGPLMCKNGSLSGVWYDCHLPRNCKVDPRPIVNVGVEACVGGNVVEDGARCIPQCAEGFVPAGDGPVCRDGLLAKASARGPAFECVRHTTTPFVPASFKAPTAPPTLVPTAQPTAPPTNLLGGKHLASFFKSAPPWLLYVAAACAILLCIAAASVLCRSRKSRGTSSGQQHALASRTSSMSGLLTDSEDDGAAEAGDLPRSRPHSIETGPAPSAPVAEGSERIISASHRPMSAADEWRQTRQAASSQAPGTSGSLTSASDSAGGRRWGGTAHEVPWSEVSLRSREREQQHAASSGLPHWSDVRALE
jgi:hypothetical protein